MAKTKSRTGQAKQVKRSRKSSVIVIAIVVLILGGFYWWFFGGGVYMGEKVKMEQYLEEKYGKEFVVEKPERKASGLGVEGYLEASAHPVSDPGLDFKVRSSSTSTSDEYVGELWSREEKKRLKPIFNRIFDKNESLELEVRTTGTARGNLSISGNVPTFESSIQKYGDKVLYILTIKSSRNTVPNELEKNNTAEKLLELRNKIPLSATDVIVNYYTQPIKTNNSRIYGISMSGDDFKKIKSSEELTNKFKEWKVAS